MIRTWWHQKLENMKKNPKDGSGLYSYVYLQLTLGRRHRCSYRSIYLFLMCWYVVNFSKVPQYFFLVIRFYGTSFFHLSGCPARPAWCQLESSPGSACWSHQMIESAPVKKIKKEKRWPLMDKKNDEGILFTPRHICGNITFILTVFQLVLTVARGTMSCKRAKATWL